METRIRRYFTFRRLNSKVPQVHHTTDELDLISIPYESTHKGRAPVLSAAPRTSEMVRTKDDLDILAIRTFPYDSVVAGTPPVFGATPIKGNGPVKLQTSRRLSSGELLVTTQDYQRTLSDIRDGEYIVGRKDPNRISKTISIKLPIHNKTSTPRASLALTSATSIPSPAQSPNPEPKPSRNHVPEPFSVEKTHETSEIPTPEVTPRSPYSGGSSTTKAYVLSPAETPLPLSPGKPPSSRNSLLSKGEEQNATIQALWRAEYARLVAIYGQDGVDRNIAELNKSRFGPSPGNRFSLENKLVQLSAASGAPPQSPVDTIIPPLASPGASIAQDLPFVDTGSDYSSVKVPSLLSSEESSSSHTKRTSLFEVDVPTTREEVSRIVESMRKNYLKALEAKHEEQSKPRRPKKSKLRASYTHTSVSATATAVKSSKTGRQSWHASTTHVTSKQDKPPRKQAGPAPKMARTSKAASVRSTTSTSSLNRKPQLYRADSTTLGSFFGARKGSQSSASAARTAKEFKPESQHRIVAQAGNARPSTNESTSPRSSSDTVAPEIDDFDIFYQDLTRDLGPAPNNKHAKSSLPAIYVPHDGKTPARPGDAAPPPPDIDCAPRKRSVLSIL